MFSQPLCCTAFRVSGMTGLCTVRNGSTSEDLTMLFPPGTAQGSLTGTVAYEGLDVLQDLAKSNKPSRAYYILM